MPAFFRRKHQVLKRALGLSGDLQPIPFEPDIFIDVNGDFHADPILKEWRSGNAFQHLAVGGIQDHWLAAFRRGATRATSK